VSLPTPKELLKRMAEFQDNLIEAATRPIRDMAEAMGLPAPQPPKAAELVEALPELPTPEALLPFPAARRETRAQVAEEKIDEVGRIAVPAEARIEKTLKMKIV